MTQLQFGNKIISKTSSIKKINQTIDAAVSINDPVFFDDASATWKKSDSTTIVPQGVFQGSGIVVTFGLLTTTGLTPGKFYFLDSLGGLTFFKSNTFIGYAKSATELLVDIDIDREINNRLTIAVAGYMAAGGTTTNVPLSNIDRMDFVTLSHSTIANLALALFSTDGFSSSTNGYTVGGTTGSVGVNTIQKTLLSTEITSISASLLALLSIGDTSNIESSSAGYIFTGGASTPNVIQKLLVSNDFVSILANNNPNTLNIEPTGLQNEHIVGYAVGGVSTADITLKLRFITDNTSSLLIVIPSTFGLMGGVSDTIVAGYLLGGENDATKTATSFIRKLNFIDENPTLLTASLSGNRARGGSTSSLTHGFNGTGLSATPGNIATIITSIEQFDFATETASNTGFSVSVGREVVSSFRNVT